MTFVEALAGVLVLALALVMTAGVYLGLLAIVGAIRFVKCDRCGHLGMTSASEPLRTCTVCRHGRLFHPLLALHHDYLGHVRSPEEDAKDHRQTPA